jgi:membrane associated rhomboid family serine protease
MSTIIEDLKRQFKSGDILTRLIFINVAVYALYLVLYIISGLALGDKDFLIGYLIEYSALNTNVLQLLFRPWTIVTHMFVHSMDIFHLLGNMVMLYFLGRLFLNFFTRKQLLGLYFLGGLIGAIALIIVSNISPFFPGNVTAVGASAAVMSISIAACTFAPNQQVFLFGFFKVALKWVALFLVLSDVVFFYDGNTGGHIAHLGGAAVGYWFTASMRSGKDITSGINKIIDWLVNLFQPSPNLKVEFRRDTKNMTDEEYNYHKKVSQDEIDAILDKISASGYDSLTKREKEILFKHSKQN